MDPRCRQACLRLLYEARPDVLLCREIEAFCHGHSASSEDYWDHVRRAAFNLETNPAKGVEVVLQTDEALAVGTPSGRIEEGRRARREQFEAMLRDKLHALDDQSFQAIVTCRACGSTDVRWEEKQTRSADEGASVFCMCNACKNRWVLR